MSTRAWYRYNDIPGGQLNPINYFYVSTAPICSTTDPNVCSVLGVYSPASNHPSTFSPRLSSYISDAIAFAAAQPPSVKAFVYVKQ